MRLFAAMLAALALCLQGISAVAAETYFPSGSLKLAMFLAPPPASD